MKKKSKSLVYICTDCGKGMLNDKETIDRHKKHFCKGTKKTNKKNG